MRCETINPRRRSSKKRAKSKVKQRLTPHYLHPPALRTPALSRMLPPLLTPSSFLPFPSTSPLPCLFSFSRSFSPGAVFPPFQASSLKPRTLTPNPVAILAAEDLEPDPELDWLREEAGRLEETNPIEETGRCRSVDEVAGEGGVGESRIERGRDIDMDV